MGVEATRVQYLRMASGHLGPIYERHIQQRGEPIAGLAAPASGPRPAVAVVGVAEVRRARHGLA